MRQFGEAEWNKMVEQDRQRELMRLKILEKQLRREGKP